MSAFTQRCAVVPIRDILPQRRLVEIPPLPSNTLARELFEIGMNAMNPSEQFGEGESPVITEQRSVSDPKRDFGNRPAAVVRG